MYIKTMAEMGIIGTAAVLFLLVHIASTMVQVIRKTWNTRLEGVALGLAAMLIAWLILGLFADLFVDTIVYFYLGILFALNRTLQKSPQDVSLEHKGIVERALLVYGPSFSKITDPVSFFGALI